jgi:hypothetical protein
MPTDRKTNHASNSPQDVPLPVEVFALANTEIKHIQSLAAINTAINEIYRAPFETTGPVIWSHGKGSYSRDKTNQFTVSDEFDRVLRLFLKEPLAMQTDYIQGEAAVTNVAKTFSAMQAWNNGILATAIRTPDGVKCSEYFVRVLEVK